MNPPAQSRRLVLACNFVRDGLQQVAERRGWRWRYSIGPDPAPATEYVWQIDPELTFHVFASSHYPVCYCTVIGPRANDVLVDISPDLMFLEVNDLIEAYDSSATTEDWRALTFALGICAAGPVGESIASRIVSSFNRPEPEVRLAAVDAAFVTGWAVLEPEIQRLAASDPDAAVRVSAANAVRNRSQAPPNTNK